MHFKLNFKKKFQKKIKNKTFYLFTFFKNKNKLESCLRDKNFQISITPISAIESSHLNSHDIPTDYHYIFCTRY